MDKIQTLDLRNADYAKLARSINELFNSVNIYHIILANTELFNSQKQLILSSTTIKTHTHHVDITAYDYAKIPQMLKGEKTIFMQNEKVYIIIKALDKSYRLSIKNILNTNEVFVSSLVKLSSFGGLEKEIKKLSKKYEIVRE